MTLLPIVVVATMIALTALFVAAEFAVVAVPKPQLSRLAGEGKGKAQKLLAIVEDRPTLDRYIAASQIGISITSLIIGAYGQAALAPWVAGALERTTSLQPSTAASSAALLVLLVLTTLQVVVGELMPKYIALQLPLETALLTYTPMALSVWSFRWFIALLNGSGILLLRALRMDASSHQHVHSPEEIDFLLAESRAKGTLTAEVHRQLQRGLHLSQLAVRDLMVPRNRLAAVDVATASAPLLAKILESPYSQLVVYRGTLDDVLGTVSTKDIVGLVARQAPGATPAFPPLERLVRPIPFVPETLRADRLVRFLQERQRSKAIVVDEYGSVEGFVTIEDLLGELFGNVHDELKSPAAAPRQLSDGRTLLPGAMPLRDAAPFIGGEPESSATTIGGFVTECVGRLPREGDKVEVHGIEVTVHAMKKASVAWIAVPAPAEPSTEEETA